MSSIVFELGRDIANEVKSGMQAHTDVKEGKQVERRQDKWGDPLAPKTVYSIVRGVEETLGMGKSKPSTSRQISSQVDVSQNQSRVTEVNGATQDVGQPSSKDTPPNSSLSYVESTFASLDFKDKPTTPAASTSPPADASAHAPSHDIATQRSGTPVSKDLPTETSVNRIQLDGIGSPVPRASGLSAELRPPPPPPPTRSDKIKKGLETADDAAAEIALGIMMGNVLDGPTQTLVEGLMMIEDEETPQSQKNREGLKAARKAIDKQTPKREELAKKLAGYQERLDEPAGGRSEERMEKDRKRIREKMSEVQKDLDKVMGKLEKAEFDVGKLKPRVEEHERLVREKRLKKAEEKLRKQADKQKVQAK